MSLAAIEGEVLKEERKCKVVLLLNDKEHESKAEFDKQLEKVADITLQFSPTPDEAAAIGLSRNKDISEITKPLVVKLGITNIRKRIAAESPMRARKIRALGISLESSDGSQSQ